MRIRPMLPDGAVAGRRVGCIRKPSGSAGHLPSEPKPDAPNEPSAAARRRGPVNGRVDATDDSKLGQFRRETRFGTLAERTPEVGLRSIELRGELGRSDAGV